MIRLASSQSSISFPTSSPATSSSSAHVHFRSPHLPFRRISLPTPTPFQRLSAASVASFDSLPEEGSESGNHLVPNGRQHKSSLTSTSTAAEGVRRRSIETPAKGVGRERGRHKAKYSSEAASALIAGSHSKLRIAREARLHRRRKIIQEFFNTEKTYVDGLDFIYHHFLSPLIASLETPEPLLDRTSLTRLFSNFIDIWNLHKAFFNALTQHLSPMLTSESSDLLQHAAALAPPPPPLSPILLSHFPYLSLYTPFITAFPSILSTLASLTTSSSFSHPNQNYSKSFSDFLAKQETHPRCGKLKFRDWMLTIVQRCPRYLLLLKDLRSCTEPAYSERASDEGEDEGEYERLGRVLDLVSKITSSLNASLQAHAQTLSLISLQRSTSNLPLSPPFQFVLPGRTLLKRGPLYQIERSEPPREREFLLFSDCLVWLAKKGTASEETLGEWGWGRGKISSRFMGSSESVSDATADARAVPASAVYGNRNRSMSDAHLPLSSPWKSNNNNNNGDGSRSTPSSPRKAKFPSSQLNPATKLKPQLKRHSMAGVPVTSTSGNEENTEERWVYKGRLDLVDLEVVVSSEWGVEQRRFEILSTEGSFALYAGTEDDRDDWVSTIRQAKAQWLVSLNVTHPNSTLTSSASTNHVRKSLQALPFAPSASSSLGNVVSRGGRRKRAESVGDGRTGVRRSKVEHWVPAIWIPDERTKECMRCGQAFGWRRRRHHCRLCGRCVCATCSEMTFYVTDTNLEGGKEGPASKPARACNVCYETVFPILDAETEREGRELYDSGLNPSLNNNQPAGVDPDTHVHDWDTITSLSNFSAWLSTPSFSVLPGGAETSSSSSPLTPSTPKALMGMEFERVLGDANGRSGRVRLRSFGKNANSTTTRPLSTLQVFEEGIGGDEVHIRGGRYERPQSLDMGVSGDDDDDAEKAPLGKKEQRQRQHASPKPVESTVKRRKRFSLPAIALQPLNVTARTIVDSNGSDSCGEGSSISSSGPTTNGGAKGERSRSRRFSLVSGGPFQRSRLSLALDANVDDDDNGPEDGSAVDSRGVGGKSVVMGKLSELLKSSKTRVG